MYLIIYELSRPSGLIIFSLFWISCYLSVYFADFCDTKVRTIPKITLPDVLFKVIPKAYEYDAPDRFIFIFQIAYWITIVVFHQDFYLISAKYFISYGIVLIQRIIVMLLTQLPDPEQSCLLFPTPPFPLLHRLLNIQSNRACGDLMFSGHTSCIVITILGLLDFHSQYQPFITIAFSILGIVEVFMIIASRMHYSFDIFIGAIISFLVYKQVNISIKHGLLGRALGTTE